MHAHVLLLVHNLRARLFRRHPHPRHRRAQRPVPHSRRGPVVGTDGRMMARRRRLAQLGADDDVRVVTPLTG